ncbi:hypothetical protein [uncultured Bacteroides sp.]|uniref:hypothetical protein n=1 Tax=uncultured Bacteroides sp. TaxID=162156 RepID=UPI002AAAD4F7|nr:hypothetical protein [uncultured Bacteroides sp.]
MKKILTFFLLFLSLCGIESCQKDTLEDAGFPTLYNQPLNVIQRSIRGRWQLKQVLVGGFVGYWYPKNSYYELTGDSYSFIDDDGKRYSGKIVWSEGLTSKKEKAWFLRSVNLSRPPLIPLSLKHDTLFLDSDTVGDIFHQPGSMIYYSEMLIRAK